MRRIALSVILVTTLAVALTPLARADGPESDFPAAEQLCEAQGGAFIQFDDLRYGCGFNFDLAVLNLAGAEAICEHSFGKDFRVQATTSYLCIPFV